MPWSAGPEWAVRTPGQLAAANAIFSPSAAEVAHARRIVEAYEAAVAVGRGVVSLDGRMVDAANIRMARVVLERHEQTGRAADKRRRSAVEILGAVPF